MAPSSQSRLFAAFTVLLYSAQVLAMPAQNILSSSSDFTSSLASNTPSSTPTTSSTSSDAAASSDASIKLVLDWSKANRKTASQMAKRQTDNSTLAPVIDADFPDPGLLQDADGKWVSYATSGNSHSVQVATADDPYGNWTLLDEDALPDKGWTSGSNYWAPDVRLLDDGSYIMYFSGQLSYTSSHCVGVARSNSSTGPFTIDGDGPLICPVDQGGAIDPSGFKDEATGRRYIVYKVDGNAKGLETPLNLQEVDASDGSTLIGDPVTIMNRIEAEDGPLVEAPNLVKLDDGRYLLFFSSHLYTDYAYDVKYAVADSINGTYVRGAEALLSTPELGLLGPGGGTSSEDPGTLVFHGYCETSVRCMYVLGYVVV